MKAQKFRFSFPSVRIVGIVRPEDQMELTSEIAVKSPWSERISFENLVNLQPTITTLQPVVSDF